MPELPEVETVKRGLDKLIVGKMIANVSFDWGKSFPNSKADVENFLVGAQITGVRRRAKVLLIDLSTNYSLMIHLKMTGQLVFAPQIQEALNTKFLPAGRHGETLNKSKKNNDKKSKNLEISNSDLGFPNAEQRWGAGHPNDSLIGKLPDSTTRVIFDIEWVDSSLSVLQQDAVQGSKDEGASRTDSTASERATPADAAVRLQSAGAASFASRQSQTVHKAQLFFNDQRKFGWVKLIPTQEIQNTPFMQKLGPEPFGDAHGVPPLTSKIFIERVQRRANSSIKAALLDQTVLAGVGNIYADEALWAAKIHPATKVKSLSRSDLDTLLREIKAVLQLAIEKGGSTDRNYVNAEGKKGSYINFAKVFRREGQPCLRCGFIVEKIRVAGRGTHICLNCQKAP